MEITKTLLLNGKPTLIKDKEYLATKEYVEPFLNEMSTFTNHFVINVTIPNQITVTNKEEDITFNKVWIQAILPESEKTPGMKEVINFVYGLDIKKPIYKVFRSYLIEDKHFIFDRNWITINELDPEKELKYSISTLMSMTNNVVSVIDKMKKTFIDDDKKYSVVGELIEKTMLFEYNTIGGKVKLSPNMIIKSYESIYVDATSKYYKSNQECSIYDLYCTLADQITDGSKKDLMNVFEKTILIGDLFNLI